MFCNQFGQVRGLANVCLTKIAHGSDGIISPLRRNVREVHVVCV